MDELTNIHSRFKNVRNLYKLTQQEFSDQLSVDRVTISQIEGGKILPTITLLIALCTKYDISLDWLIADIGKMLRSDAHLNAHPTAHPIPKTTDNMATKEENRPYKKGDVSYTEEEIAVMAIQAKYLTTALLQPIIGAIGALAFFLNPAMEQKVLKELPKMIEDRYLEAISNDPKISEAHADQFVEVLKELLNSR